MMNLFQLQEQLRDFSKDQLLKEMQSPSGNAPPFLVMTELQRRSRMENAAALDKGPPTSTVAQDTVNAAGVPQGGIADMARSMAPQTDMTQNTGALTPQAGAAPQGAAPVQAMQEGGLAGISRNVSDYGVEQDPAVVAMADRLGMTPAEYLASLDPEAQAQQARRVARNRMLEMEPRGDGVTFPSQEDLDIRAAEGPVTDEMLTERGIARGGVNPSSVESDAVPTYFPDASINPTMSGGIAALTPPEQGAPYTPPSGRTGTAEDYAESLAAAIEGRPATPAPRNRTAGGLDIIDVSDTAFSPRTTPAEAPPAPIDEYLSAIPLGDLTAGLTPRADRVANAAVDRRIGGDQPQAPASEPEVTLPSGMYRSMDEMTSPPTDPNYGYIDPRVGYQGPRPAFIDQAIEALTSGSPTIAGYEYPQDYGTVEPPEVVALTPEEDLAGMTPEELLPAAPEAPVLTPVPQTTQAQRSGAGSATSGVSGNGMAVPPPQTAEDRMLQQDKWLALARFGAALSSSQAPTFGQALGQATQVGLDALGQARQDFLQRKAAADDMAMQRAALVARTAGRGGAGAGALPRVPIGAVGIFDDQIEQLQNELMRADPAREVEITNELGRLIGLRTALQAQFLAPYNPELALASLGGGTQPPPATDVADEGETSTMDRVRGLSPFG